MRVQLTQKPPSPPPLSEADHARLVQAAYKGDLPQLRRLAKEKPSFSQAVFCTIVNEDGWNVLMLSTLFCHMKVIEWLLSGCRSTRDDEEEDHEVGEAAGNELGEAGNDAATAHRIVQMINQQDREGITAVFLAAYHNHQFLLALLLAHGADPNKEHKDGLSPLGVAIYRGHLSLVAEVLLPHPRLDVNARDDAGGRTALFQAAYWGKTEALQLLLREKREGGGGADPMVMTKVATCAVQVARAKGHLGCVMLLEVRRGRRRRRRGGGRVEKGRGKEEDGLECVITYPIVVLYSHTQEWERAFLLHKLRCVHDKAVARQATTSASPSFSTTATSSSSPPSSCSQAVSANAAARGPPWLQMHTAEADAKEQQVEQIGERAGKDYAAAAAAVLGMVVTELNGDLFGELKEYIGRTCGWYKE